MSLTNVFCCKCMKVTPCETHQDYDRWWWICTLCGKEADEEFKDHEDDRDEDTRCPRCGDSGQIPAADGYHEYMGYSYLPCPDCPRGCDVIPDGPRSPYES